MEIRSATPPDAEGIQDVLHDSSRAAYADRLDDDAFIEMVADQEVDPLAEWLAETQEDAEVVYLVAVDDTDGESMDTAASESMDTAASESVVGFAQLLAGERAPDHVDADSFLKSLYVHPDRWGEGIGTQLLDDAIDRLPDSYESVELSVFSANDLARGFYERYGFEQVGEGSFPVEDVVYETTVYAMNLD